MEYVTAMIARRHLFDVLEQDGLHRSDWLLPSSPVSWRGTCTWPVSIPDILIRAFGRRFSRDGLALATTQITAAVLEDLI